MESRYSQPTLSFLQIWNMCFGFLGIQFGFALQNANVSRIFQTLGASIEHIPVLWIAAPLTGLLVQPLVGYFSDNTWNRFGRRRPYFFCGAVFTTCALFVMPNSANLWIAAGMLWIMDASINMSMEPFRALVGDMLPRNQRALGFATQSFFIGIGAIIASALPWILTNYFGTANTASNGELPDSVVISFYVGGAVMFIAVAWSALTTKEYTPAQLGQFNSTGIHVETSTKGDSFAGLSHSRISCWLLSGLVILLAVVIFKLDQQLYILSACLIAFSFLKIYVRYQKKKNKTPSVTTKILDDFHHMPTTMKQLALVQFFSWFALFSMWIYTTSAVSEIHFGSSDTTSLAYNEGANWVGILFASYNGFAALAAFAIPVLARLSGLKITHLVNLCCGGAGLISIAIIRDPNWLILSMVGVGIAWASILSIPYALLSSVIPAKKMGVYMGIFNFFIVIPQILAATLIGFIVRVVFNGQAIYALVLGGVLLIIGGITTLFVDQPLAEDSSTPADDSLYTR